MSLSLEVSLEKTLYWIPVCGGRHIRNEEWEKDQKAREIPPGREIQIYYWVDNWRQNIDYLHGIIPGFTSKNTWYWYTPKEIDHLKSHLFTISSQSFLSAGRINGDTFYIYII